MVALAMSYTFLCPSHEPWPSQGGPVPMLQPGCPTDMASPNGVMAQREAQLQPLLLASLWKTGCCRAH